MYSVKIALRTLLHGKIYTLISILGLALGITVSMLIAAIVIDELSYDKHWARSSDIYRLISVAPSDADFSHKKNGAAYAGLAPELKRNFPEVEEYSTLYVSPIDFKFEKGTDVAVNVVALYTDTAVQRLLDINIIKSENLIPSKDITKIVISKTFAHTYFDGQEVIGKIIYDAPQYDDVSNEYLIVGIMEDLPPNSHLRSDVIIIENRQEKELHRNDSGMFLRHYILLKSGTDYAAFQKKVNNWYTNYVEVRKSTQFELQSIQDSYLKSDFGAYQIIRGSQKNISIYAGIGFLVLLIACINFVNLTTAQISSRLQDTGIRKVLGASRGRLIRQFLLESLLIFSAAFAISVLLYLISVPSVEQFIGNKLAFASTYSWQYFLGIITIVIALSLVSGLYPAWFVSRFATVGVISKSLKTSKSSKSHLRSVLVITQFSLSIIILVALFVIQNQVSFMKNKETGIDTDGLISIGGISFDNKSSAFKNRLSAHADVKHVSLSSWLPAEGSGYMYRLIDNPKNPQKKLEVWYIAGEPNLAETLGFKLKEGRWLHPSLATDAIDANDLLAEAEAVRPCLITATTVDLLDNPTLNAALPEAKTLVPVGVIEDFNSESLHKSIVPTVLVGYTNPRTGSVLIRSSRDSEDKVMRYITQVWKDLYPDKLLELNKVKETLAAQYYKEEKLEQIFTASSILTLFLAGLGIFGLMLNMISLRTKEIGIRKVLGASVAGIVGLLSKDFVRVVLIAILIASPIAWWAMTRWLEDFAYRIEIQWWMFAIAGLLAVLVALATVSYQAIRAAIANPVNSLRDE